MKRRPLARRLGPSLVAVIMLASACSGSADTDASGAEWEDRIPTLEPVVLPEADVVDETRTFIGDDGGVASVGEASLTVPPGSLEPGTIVVAQQLSDPAAGASDLSVAAVPGPVRFLADGEVLGPLTVRIPVAAGVDSARILSAEEGSILWFDEMTEVSDGHAVAEVDHLTSFAAVAADVSNLTYTLFRLLDARTDVPDCPQGPPEWVLDIISPARESIANGDRPNAPLLPCGDRIQRGGQEQLALRVAANRGYSVVVRAPDDTVERRALQGGRVVDIRSDAENLVLTTLADELGAVLQPEGGDREGELYAIPLLRTSEFIIADPLGSDPGFRLLSLETVPPLDPEALAFSILVDLYAVALAQVGSSGIEQIADCVGATVAADGTDGLQESIDAFDACVGVEEAAGWLDLGRWVKRAAVPVQIGLLTAERAVDMFNPDRIDIAVENLRTGDPADPPGPAVGTAAAMWRGDAGRTGIHPEGAPVSTPEFLWEFRDAASPAIGVPVAVDGRVHVSTEDGRLITLDLATGEELWRFIPPVGGRLTTPLVADGLVIVHADEAGVVHALDAATGSSRWRTPLSTGDPSSGGVFTADGRAYITTSPEDGSGAGSRIDVLRVADGRIETTIALEEALWSGAVAVDGPTLVAGMYQLRGYRTSDGSLAWTERDEDGTSILDVALRDGIVYATRTLGGFNEPTALIAYDATSGASRWSAPDAGPSGLGWQWSGGFIDLLTAPAVDSDSVYIGGWLANEERLEPAAAEYGVLLAFDRRSGEERWRTRLPGALIGAPAISGDVVIVTAFIFEGERGQLHGIERQSGRELWRVDVRSRVRSAYPSGKVILVIDDSGAVTAFG